MYNEDRFPFATLQHMSLQFSSISKKTSPELLFKTWCYISDTHTVFFCNKAGDCIYTLMFHQEIIFWSGFWNQANLSLSGIYKAQLTNLFVFIFQFKHLQQHLSGFAEPLKSMKIITYLFKHEVCSSIVYLSSTDHYFPTGSCLRHQNLAITAFYFVNFFFRFSVQLAW